MLDRDSLHQRLPELLMEYAVELRRIYHHDGRVRAHFTFRVLALLLQRVLEGCLATRGHPMTAVHASKAVAWQWVSGRRKTAHPTNDAYC